MDSLMEREKLHDDSKTGEEKTTRFAERSRPVVNDLRFLGVLVAFCLCIESAVVKEVAGMHAMDFACYVCDASDNSNCCAQPRLMLHPLNVYLFDAQDFFPTCVTKRVNGQITARFPKELPFTKSALVGTCQWYYAADDQGAAIELCYCSNPGCNNDVDCAIDTTTESATDSPTTSDVTSTESTLSPPVEPKCPATTGVKIGGEKYDLSEVEPGEFLRVKCKTPWPDDPIGSTEGYAVWLCDTSGQWELDAPDFSGCWTVDYKSLTTKIQNAEEPKDIISVLGNLTKTLQTTGDATVGGDLTRGVKLATDALQTLRGPDGPAMGSTEVAVKLLEAFLLLNEQFSAMATGWRTCGGRYEANFLMVSVLDQPFQAAYWAMAGTKPEDLVDDPIVFNNLDSMKLELTATKMASPAGPRLASNEFSYLDSSVWLHLGVNYSDSSMAQHGSPLRMAAMGYKNMHEHFSSPIGGESNKTSDWTPTSRIYGIQAFPDNSDNEVPDGSFITFHAANLCPLTSEEFKNRTPVCFGLQHIENNLAPKTWSSKYCTLDGSDEVYTRCRCDHRVSMMIAAVKKRDGDLELCKSLSDEDKTFPDIVLPGYSIAVTCFLLALLVFVFKQPRSCGPLLLTRSNFAFSNVIMFFALIGAVKMKPDTDLHACNMFGGIAVFGLFASSAWLAVDALCVKQLLSGQTKDSGIIAGRRRPRKVILPIICYGLPTTVISITAMSTSWVDFMNSDYCFINLDTSSAWALAVFTLSALAVAYSSLTSAMAKLQKARSWDCGDPGDSTNATANDDYGAPEAFIVKKSLFECLFFTVFLTCSWICGLIYFSEGDKSAAVGFTIFNTLQGMLAFCAYGTSAFRNSSGGGTPDGHMFPPGRGLRRTQQQQRQLSFIDAEMRDFPSTSSPSIRNRQQTRSSRSGTGDVEAESAF